MTIHLEPLDMTQAEAARAEADKANPPPKGFKLTGEGIQYEGEPDDDGKTAWHWLCSPIRVLALPRGEDGKGWGRLVEVIDPDGNAHRWALPASLFAGDGAELRAELMRLGFRLSTSPKARQRLSDLLQQWTPKARATTTDRLGWPSAACRGFVLGSGRVIGDQSLVYQVEQAPGAAAHMHERGDLEEWKARVSSLCVGNPMLALGVSIAFAGPLLEPLQVDGGGVHFRGESSTGKTTTSRAERPGSSTSP